MSAEYDMLRQIIVCPGSSDHDIAEMQGDVILSVEDQAILDGMVSRGEVKVVDDVIGFRTRGRPIRGKRYYPTAEGTSRCLFEYILQHPGCSELELEREFAPCGGVPNWLETDFQRLLSENRIRFERIGMELNARTLVIVRLFEAVPQTSKVIA